MPAGAYPSGAWPTASADLEADEARRSQEFVFNQGLCRPQRRIPAPVHVHRKLDAVRLRRRHYLPAIFDAGRQRLLAQQMLAPSGRRQRDPLLLHARHRHVDDIRAGIVPEAPPD